MKFLQNLLNFLDRKTFSFGAQYELFAIFMIVNSPIGYLLLYYGGGQYNESLTIRITAMILCIPLIFAKKWPLNLKRYLNLYWYIVVFYCIPFLGTYIALKNHLSSEWLMNWPIGLFWLILVVDWSMFAILLFSGIILGSLFYLLSGNEITISIQSISLTTYCSIYFYSIVIGCLFSRNKAKIDYERTLAIKAVGGTIAHEMRTPLLVVQTIASGMEDHMPTLVEAYQRTQNSGDPIKKIPAQVLPLLSKGPQTIQQTTRSAFTVIDMLMVNIQENPADTEVEYCSILACVDEALKTYPLSQGEEDLISVKIDNDFHFYGVKRLTIHVFFNLIKNALYYIKAASKGTITIWTESTSTENQLHFKDTGKGIPKNVLPHIFERFYGKTRSGTGIGLAFCDMVMRNAEGTISCLSEEGEFTQFILSFPKVQELS